MGPAVAAQVFLPLGLALVLVFWLNPNWQGPNLQL
jgi:hypothetical protein